jgi:hypothetical protein
MYLRLKPKRNNNARIKGALHLGEDTVWISGLLVSGVEDLGAGG